MTRTVHLARRAAAGAALALTLLGSASTQAQSQPPSAAPTAAPAPAAVRPVCGLSNGQKATGAPIPIGAVVGRTGPDDFSASAAAAAASTSRRA
jgi:glucose/arabinose dehydrogenase